tara:strand:+ start:162 stop:359 length:198 start_codon:yes stop_codon:yes gene_type:complete
MSKELLLQTGDKVSWSTGMFNKDKMIGVVLEDLEDGSVDIVSHTLNGKTCVLSTNVQKSKLSLTF